MELVELLVMQPKAVLIQLLQLGIYQNKTIRLVFFECCKDGHWARFWNLWIYAGLPFVGAFLSLTLIRILYKDCYEK